MSSNEPQETSLSQTTGHRPDVTRSWKLYSQCGKLPLDRFLDCLFDKEFDRLVIDGNPPQEAIDEAWQKVYLEYLSLSQSKSYNETFEKTKEINVLNSRLVFVESVCRHLQFSYDADMVKMLEKLDLKPGITGGENSQQMLTKLKLVITRAKKWLVQIGKKRAELDKLQEKTEEVKDGRGNFEDMLTALTKFLGVFVKETDYTVSRYTKDVNRMVEFAQKQKLKAK